MMEKLLNPNPKPQSDYVHRDCCAIQLTLPAFMNSQVSLSWPLGLRTHMYVTGFQLGGPTKFGIICHKATFEHRGANAYLY